MKKYPEKTMCVGWNKFLSWIGHIGGDYGKDKIEQHSEIMSEESKLNWRKQRDIHVKPMRKSETHYYSSLNEKENISQQNVLEVVTSSFSNKTIANEKVTLIEGDGIKDNKGTVGVINTFLFKESIILL